MILGISCLSSELLLAVFECLLPVPDSTLFNCMLCCKAWYPAARSVLYRDIVLSSENLIKFVNSDWSADWSIRSLTLRLNTLFATQDEIQAMSTWHESSQAARQLWRALERLSLRIKNMETSQVSPFFAFSALLPSQLFGSLTQASPASSITYRPSAQASK